jgi:O-antigen ligase
MTKEVLFWDRVMFGGVLLLTLFIPYSSVMIQVGLFTMLVAWLMKRSLIWKANSNRLFFDNFKLPPCGLEWPLFMIGLLIIVTLPFSHAPALTFKKFFSRFLQQIILMYFVIEAVTTPKRLYYLITTLLATFAVVTADIFVQYFCGHSFIFNSAMLQGQRVTGPMRHPNDLGTLLVMILPIILSLILTRKFWIPLIFKSRSIIPITALCGTLFGLLIIALGLTVSRGAWVAFIITLIGLSVFLKNNRLTGVVIGLFVLFFWFFGMRCIMLRTDISQGFTQEKSSLTSPKDSAVSSTTAAPSLASQAPAPTSKPASYSHSVVKVSEKVFLNPSRRFEYWGTASSVIKMYPLFGCGYNTYIQTLQKLNLYPQEYPHNSIMHIAAEVGLIGLAGYIWFWLALFFNWKRILDTIFLNRELYILGAGIGFSLLAWLIHSFTDTAWESLPLSIFWWLLIGVLFSLVAVSRQLDINQKGA